MIEDKILVWRFRHSSPQALARICCRYEALLLTIAATYLGDKTDAQDVVHEVFLSLAQRPDRVGLITDGTGGPDAEAIRQKEPRLGWSGLMHLPCQ